MLEMQLIGNHELLMTTTLTANRTQLFIHYIQTVHFIDVSIAHPCAPTYVIAAARAQPCAPEQVSDVHHHVHSGSISQARPTIKQRESRKINYYSDVTHDHHAKFYPHVTETYGAIGDYFNRLLCMLASDAADYHQQTEQESSRWLFHARCSIAIALQVGNAIISSRAMRAARASHQHHVNARLHPSNNSTHPHPSNIIFQPNTDPSSIADIDLIQIQQSHLHHSHLDLNPPLESTFTSTSAA